MKGAHVKFFIAAAAICVIGFAAYASGENNSGLLQVTFFDVGQGDASFAQLPGGQDILIDGGPDSSVSRAVGRTLPFLDRYIDVVLLTHPDGDHITGLIDIIRTYRIGSVLMPPVSRTTEEYKHFMEIVNERSIPVVYAKSGQVFQFASGITLEILSSGNDAQVAAGLLLNDSAIVAKMTYHEIDFLFTGDITSTVEHELVQTKANLSSEILRVPHHGSRYSSSSEFIQAVHPSVAIISSGQGNPYGHPHQETLDRLIASPARILRTDKAGEIKVTSNGSIFEITHKRK